jgi:hypothetical protein
MIPDDSPRRGIVHDFEKSERINFLFAEIARGVARDPSFGAGGPDEEDCPLDSRDSRNRQKSTS